MNTFDKKSVNYSASGVVLGNLWSGEEVGYPAKDYSADTYKDLVTQLETALEDNSLDDGMGFESLIAAFMVVTTITTITINDKEFINKEQKELVIGKTSDENIEFLENLYYEQY